MTFKGMWVSGKGFRRKMYSPLNSHRSSMVYQQLNLRLCIKKDVGSLCTGSATNVKTMSELVHWHCKWLWHRELSSFKSCRKTPCRLQSARTAAMTHFHQPLDFSVCTGNRCVCSYQAQKYDHILKKNLDLQFFKARTKYSWKQTLLECWAPAAFMRAKIKSNTLVKSNNEIKGWLSREMGLSEIL